jgi:prevent-host-death family protein
VQIGIRELRGELAAVVRRAAAGESVVVTVSGRPTAVIGPLVPTPTDPTLDDLVAAGTIVGPRRRPGEQRVARERLPVDARSDAELRKVR